MLPFLYPLKTSQSHRFSDIFRGYRIGTLAQSTVVKVDVVDKHPSANTKTLFEDFTLTFQVDMKYYLIDIKYLILYPNLGGLFRGSF